MSATHEELHQLVRQLRAELEWALRTGIEVVPPKAPRVRAPAPAREADTPRAERSAPRSDAPPRSVGGPSASPPPRSEPAAPAVRAPASPPSPPRVDPPRAAPARPRVVAGPEDKLKPWAKYEHLGAGGAVEPEGQASEAPRAAESPRPQASPVELSASTTVGAAVRVEADAEPARFVASSPHAEARSPSIDDGAAWASSNEPATAPRPVGIGSVEAAPALAASSSRQPLRAVPAQEAAPHGWSDDEPPHPAESADEDRWGAPSAWEEPPALADEGPARGERSAPMPGAGRRDLAGARAPAPTGSRDRDGPWPRERSFEGRASPGPRGPAADRGLDRRGPPRGDERGPPPRAGERAPVASDRASLRVLESQLAGCTSLDGVREVLGDCTRCKLSRQGRSKIVFGVGNPRAEVMFVGEGPGADEDRVGEPFVGKAGQLLTGIIEKGMKLPRSEVYIANVVKCRPPENRPPEPDEVAACEPFVKAQLRLVQPKVIVALGKHAAQMLLKTDASITSLRGRWHSYEGVPVMPTFHPAYLLRNPAQKAPVWEDIKEVLRRLGRPLPAGGGS
jgi:uracil-DNA glycosylase family 4